MYNRYIPQADGSYRRSRIPDPKPSPLPPNPTPFIPREEPPDTPCCDEPPKQSTPCNRCYRRPQPPRQEIRSIPATGRVGSFLKQLIPKDFDTGDLLVILLLLLMAGDCPDDQNTALLTLALYLFM